MVHELGKERAGGGCDDRQDRESTLKALAFQVRDEGWAGQSLWGTEGKGWKWE